MKVQLILPLNFHLWKGGGRKKKIFSAIIFKENNQKGYRHLSEQVSSPTIKIPYLIRNTIIILL